MRTFTGENNAIVTITEFPIPMRGNEPWDMLLPPAGQQVPNPHEG